MTFQTTVKRLLTGITGITVALLCLWWYHLDDLQPAMTSAQADGNSRRENLQTLYDISPIWRFRANVSHRTPFNTLPYPPLEKRFYNNPNDSSPKIILYWTKLWKSQSWGRPTGKELFANCTYNNCRAEFDRNYGQQADIYLFYQTQLGWGYPTRRHPKQIYAVITGEPPSDSPLRKFSYHINLTLSSRLESDIVLNYVIRPKQNVLPGKYVPRIPFQNKTGNVSWLVGHCKTSSKREVYVKGLSRYIDVDIYGGCGPLKCKAQRQPSGNPCFQELEQKYKFYLSFENAICKDYATEKLVNPLRHEIVPVVLGGGNYSHITPPNSYIDAADFRTPKDLADYLHFLAENEDEYQKYLQWKHEYDYFNRQDAMCDLCEVAMKGTFQRTAETWDSGKWWEHNACDNGLVERMLATSNSPTQE